MRGLDELFDEYTALLKEDPRIIRSKRDLANALETLLTQKSLENITIKEIAHTAMVTFYNNFDDKDDLLVFLLNRYGIQILNSVHEILASDLPSAEKYSRTVEGIVMYLYKSPTPLRRIIENDSSKAFYWSLEEYIRHLCVKVLGIYKGIIDCSVPPEIFSSYFSGAFTGLIYHLVKEDKYQPEEIVKYIINLTVPQFKK